MSFVVNVLEPVGRGGHVLSAVIRPDEIGDFVFKVFNVKTGREDVET